MFSSRRSNGSATAVIELDPIQSARELSSKNPTIQLGRFTSRHDTDDVGSQGEDRNESLPSPTTEADEVLERWNSPRRNMYRTFACFWGFVLMGMNDAAYGVCLEFIHSVSTDTDTL